jgi:hypothetical protein
MDICRPSLSSIAADCIPNSAVGIYWHVPQPIPISSTRSWIVWRRASRASCNTRKFKLKLSCDRGSVGQSVLVSGSRLELMTRFVFGSIFRRTHDHILLSHLRLPQSGGPGPRIYIPQEQGGPVIPLDTGFPFHRLLRLAGLQWRYSNPPQLELTCQGQSQSQSYITTDGQSAILSSCQAPNWDLRPVFPLLSLIIFRQLRVCWCGAPSLTRSRVRSFQFLPGIASSAFLRSDSHGTHEHILLSLFLRLPHKTKKELKEIKYSDVNWIQLARDRTGGKLLRICCRRKVLEHRLV